MLKSLTVQNFALVDELEVQFDAGLTVITGESGAGKSILLGALGMVLGDRAASDTIRPGTPRADVSAEFDLAAQPEIQALLADQTLEDPDQPERLLVRRVINRDGRSRAFVNGTPVTLGVLRSLTAGLIDIHGQDDHQHLADPDVQLSLLDGYGVDQEVLGACRDCFRAWKTAATELASRTAAVRSQEDRASLLTYQLAELEEADPGPGEFEEVEQTHRRLSQAQALRAGINEVQSALEAAAGFDQACTALSRLQDDHPDLESARATLLTITDLRADALRDLRAFEDSLAVEPERLGELEARLSALHELARKHKVNPEALPELVDELRQELQAIGTDRSNLTDLEEAVNRLQADYRQHAAVLSRQRREAAEGFCTAVSEHINTLGIKGGALALEFHPAETESGAERVEYLCTTNPRYPAAPMARIASGGERTRIGLAIEIVAAERTRLPSLILDEADVGVGGTTADVVGRLLRSLAQHTQVVCITHAPQIAALGQTHLKVSKDGEQDTRIAVLGHRERVDELARMLAGARITKNSREYARTLLQEALPA
jgi:DNA repair protein RecN (Recombination protein N)